MPNSTNNPIIIQIITSYIPNIIQYQYHTIQLQQLTNKILFKILLIPILIPLMQGITIRRRQYKITFKKLNNSR